MLTRRAKDYSSSGSVV